MPGMEFPYAGIDHLPAPDIGFSTWSDAIRPLARIVLTAIRDRDSTGRGDHPDDSRAASGTSALLP